MLVLLFWFSMFVLAWFPRVQAWVFQQRVRRMPRHWKIPRVETTGLGDGPSTRHIDRTGVPMASKEHAARETRAASRFRE